MGSCHVCVSARGGARAGHSRVAVQVLRIEGGSVDIFLTGEQLKSCILSAHQQLRLFVRASNAHVVRAADRVDQQQQVDVGA